MNSTKISKIFPLFKDKAKLVLVGGSRCHYRGKIVVNYKPVRKRMVIPHFNNDGLHYTLAFISEATREQDSYYHAKFVKKYENAVQNSQMQVPKPKDSTYCSVCQNSFSDYREHLIDQEHKENSRNNKYQIWIESLARKMNKTQNKKHHKDFTRIKRSCETNCS